MAQAQKLASKNSAPADASHLQDQHGTKLDSQGYLLPEEVAKRTFNSITNREAFLGTSKNVTQLQYATWTQRGYYPDDPRKQNQDEFGTRMNFAGVKTDAMFAVYDGHGTQGHSCARFTKNKLPKYIAKHVRKTRCHKYQDMSKQEKSLKKKKGFDPDNWPMLNKEEYQKCCVNAFLEVNQAMHNGSKVPDKMSGTTATTVCFHGDLVSVGNVGDSRLVLGHRVKGDVTKGVISTYYGLNRTRTSIREEGKKDVDDELIQQSRQELTSSDGLERRVALTGTSILAIPLSKDQTPYRKDERERVKREGACVMTIDQMQGKAELHDDWGDMVLGEAIDTDGDSPRVWFDGKDYPGCAFTRSLGDAISEDVGVTGEPEMLTTELTVNDEYLVIASDGIFEFLPNQVVIDLCVASSSPLEACEKIVKQAYQQWLAYENRTDDITIIVCFLQNHRSPPTDGTKGTTEDLITIPATIYGEKSRIGVSESSNSPGNLIQEDKNQSEPLIKSSEIELSSAPAPLMALADVETEKVEGKIEKWVELVSLMNVARKSVYPTSLKDDSAASDSPENDIAQPLEQSRNTIQI